MQRLLVLLFLSVVLTGCGEAAHWYSRTFYDTDCRPEKLHNGACVSASKGGTHAHTARP